MIQIRSAVSADLERVHAIATECFGPQSTPLPQLRWLVESQGADPLLFLDVAEDDGERGRVLVGFISSKLHRIEGTRHLEVLDFAVAPVFRREGIGAELLKHAILKAGELEGRGVSLRTREKDSATLILCEKLGFIQDQVVPRYYVDGENAVLLSRRVTLPLKAE